MKRIFYTCCGIALLLATGCAITNSVYRDYLYCSPDWSGCAMLTAQDPEVGDEDIFDYVFNANCSGFRSLVYVINQPRYYGECGRSRLSLGDRISLANMGTIETGMALKEYCSG